MRNESVPLGTERDTLLNTPSPEEKRGCHSIVCTNRYLPSTNTSTKFALFSITITILTAFTSLFLLSSTDRTYNDAGNVFLDLTYGLLGMSFISGIYTVANKYGFFSCENQYQEIGRPPRAAAPPRASV